MRVIVETGDEGVVVRVRTLPRLMERIGENLGDFATRAFFPYMEDLLKSYDEEGE
jgi:hypothetical protein